MNRRGFICGLLSAPALIPASSLDFIPRGWPPVPPGFVHDGYGNIMSSRLDVWGATRLSDRWRRIDIEFCGARGAGGISSGNLFVRWPGMDWWARGLALHGDDGRQLHIHSLDGAAA